MTRDDDAVAFEIEIGALDGDAADTQLRGQPPDRRLFTARGPLARGNALADLLHDLQIQGSGVGLGDVYAAVHTVYTVYTQFRIEHQPL